METVRSPYGVHTYALDSVELLLLRIRNIISLALALVDKTPTGDFDDAASRKSCRHGLPPASSAIRWIRNKTMGLHFPLHPLLTIPCNHLLFRSCHRCCPTTPLPESVVAHTRPPVQGVGSFGSAQNGASQAPPGKGPHDARHVYWNRNRDRQAHVQNLEMPQTGPLFGMAPLLSGPSSSKKSCGRSLAISLPGSLAWRGS
ncbi:hypothetical protein J3F84DRAFT_354677 [Trichoderma pleuroticola]